MRRKRWICGPIFEREMITDKFAVYVARKAMGNEKFRSALLKLFPAYANIVHLPFGSSPSSSFFASSPYTDYKNAVWIYRCASLWGISMRDLTMRVVDSEGKPYTKNARVDQLLQEPNPDVPAAELWDAWGLEMGLSGYCGFERTKRRDGKFELWFKPATAITVQAKEGERHYGRISHFTMYRYQSSEYDLSPDDFLYYRFRNPFDEFTGFSPLDALRVVGSNEALATAYHHQLLSNGARPDYYYETTEILSSTQRKELEDRLRRDYGMQGGGIGGPMVLPEGVKVHPMTFRAEDFSWRSLKEFNRDEICGAYGVPDELAGFGKNTYENFDAAERVYWTQTVLPNIGFRDRRLTHYFRRLGWLDPGHSVRTDLTRIVPLRRVFDPMFAQALKLFTMGVPFSLINSYLGLNLPRYKGDENSYPFGTELSFDSQGELIGDESTGTVSASTQQAARFSEMLKRILEMEDEKRSRLSA